MYDGDDRVKQVDVLNEVAGDVFSNLPAEVTVGQVNQSTVLMMLGLPDMPSWFDGHDLDYLTERVKRHFYEEALDRMEEPQL